MAVVADPAACTVWDCEIGYGREKIIVKRGGFRRLVESLRATWAPKASKFAILSDEKVWKLWGLEFIEALTAAQLPYIVYTIPPGEESKTRETKSQIEDFLLKHHCGRDSCLLGRSR